MFANRVKKITCPLALYGQVHQLELISIFPRFPTISLLIISFLPPLLVLAKATGPQDHFVLSCTVFTCPDAF